MSTNRNYNLKELGVYCLGWCILVGVASAADRVQTPAIIVIPILLILPPILVGGAVGFVIGGRDWFLLGALVLGLVWLFLFALPLLHLPR